MIFFKDLKFGVKQGLSFGIIFFVLAGINAISVYNLGSLNKEIEEISNNWLERAVTLSDLNLNTSQLRSFQLEHAYTFDQSKKRLQEEEMIALIDQINDNIDKYEKLKKKYKKKDVYSNKEERLYDGFINNWEIYVDFSFNVIKLSRENNKNAAMELLLGKAKAIYTTCGDDLVSLVSLSKLDAFKATKRAEKTFVATKNLSRFMVLVAIGLSIFLIFVLVRLITIPIKQLDRAAAAVTKGNLDIWLDINSKDEIGRLAKTFLQMADSIKQFKTRTEDQATKLINQQKELQETNLLLQQKSEFLENQTKVIEQKNTDLEKALENLKYTQNKLIQSEKLASLGQLTAGIAHEINNPINFVMSNISPLRRDIHDILQLLLKYEEIIKLNDYEKHMDIIYSYKKDIDFDFLLNEIENLLNGMDDGAKRTADIVKGLRNFSRIDSGEMVMADINSGLESTLIMLKNVLKNKIEVVLNLGNIPTVLCYPGRLNQVFLNILTNAKDSIIDKGKIFIKTWNDEKYVYISIKDSGIGIDESVKERIFEPFYTTKEVGKGTGLGLSITYGIITNHNGKIDVFSKVGEGSEFVISIPNKT
ncbi:MAG: ATP-binding protein [bacterium]